MKAISLWQPWASLIAIGAKTIETRGWATGYRGPLAIHAAKRPIREAELTREMLHAFPDDAVDENLDLVLPLGAVVATCELVHVCQFHPGPQRSDEMRRNSPFGDFTPGRFGWVLRNIQPLPEPVPARGRQQLWEWDGLPPAVEQMELSA